MTNNTPPQFVVFYREGKMEPLNLPADFPDLYQLSINDMVKVITDYTDNLPLALIPVGFFNSGTFPEMATKAAKECMDAFHHLTNITYYCRNNAPLPPKVRELAVAAHKTLMYYLPTAYTIYTCFADSTHDCRHPFMDGKLFIRENVFETKWGLLDITTGTVTNKLPDNPPADFKFHNVGPRVYGSFIIEEPDYAEVLVRTESDLLFPMPVEGCGVATIGSVTFDIAHRSAVRDLLYPLNWYVDGEDFGKENNSRDYDTVSVLLSMDDNGEIDLSRSLASHNDLIPLSYNLCIEVTRP